MSKYNFDVTTKEEKKELLERLGYTVFPIIEDYTREQLETQVERYYKGSFEGYQFSAGKRPEFQKITDEGVSGTVYSLELNKYGHLVHIVSNDEPGESDVPVYYEGTEFILDGFHYPDYAYVGYAGSLCYAGRCGTDSKIMILSKNHEEVLLSDSTSLDDDVEEYLYDFLIFREKHMRSSKLRSSFSTTSMF